MKTNVVNTTAKTVKPLTPKSDAAKKAMANKPQPKANLPLPAKTGKKPKVLAHVNPEDGKVSIDAVKKQVVQVFKRYQEIEKAESAQLIALGGNYLNKGKILREAETLVEQVPVKSKARTQIMQEAWDEVMPRNEIGESSFPVRSTRSELTTVYTAYVVDAGLKIDGSYKHEKVVDSKGKQVSLTLAMIEGKKLYLAAKFVTPENAVDILAFLYNNPRGAISAYFNAASKKYVKGTGEAARVNLVAFEKDVKSILDKEGEERVDAIETFASAVNKKQREEKSKTEPLRLLIEKSVGDLYETFKTDSIIPAISDVVTPEDVTDTKVMEILLNLSMTALGNMDKGEVVHMARTIFAVAEPETIPETVPEPEVKPASKAKAKKDAPAKPADDNDIFA